MSESNHDRVIPATIRLQLLQRTMDNTLAGIIISLVCSVVLGFILWNDVSHLSVLIWIAAIFSVGAVRIAMVLVFQRQSPGADRVLFWERFYLLSILVAGIAWGLGVFFLFPVDSASHQAWLAIIYTGLVAGAMMTYNTFIPAVYAFAAPVTIMLAFSFGLYGELEQKLLAGLWMFFLGVMIYTSKQAHRMAVGFLQTSARLALEVTERRQAEEDLAKSLSLYKATIESTADGILSMNRRGNSTGFNKKFLEMWQVPESLATAGDDKKLLAHILNQIKDPDTLMEKVWILMDKPDEASIDLVEMKDGRIYDMHSQPQIIEGDIVGRIWSFRDFTKRIETEEALRQSKEKAEQATREKDKYLSLIAHDLKTPFASVISFLNVFGADEDDQIDEEKQILLDSVRKRCEMSLEVVNEVLETSRFSTGMISLKPSFFNAYFQTLTIKANLGHLAKKKEIELINNIPEKLRLYGDVKLFGEVVQNLLENAIKFCEKGDKITMFAPPGESSTIAIRDTGVGIDEKLLPDIFRRDIKTTTIGTAGEVGTGLALPICMDIIQAHGGEFTVESVKGEGSVFYVKMPEVKPLVMIVDDDEIIRLTLIKLLESMDVEIVEVPNGKTAFKTVESKKPHLILLDIIMPDFNGLDVLGQLKQNEETKNIPVIMLTSDDRIETRQKALQLGADDFISKPIKKEELIPRLSKFLE